eukprot:SAG31_NODE_3597_length_4085_cov_5.800301_6_plen_74_part_00
MCHLKMLLLTERTAMSAIVDTVDLLRAYAAFASGICLCFAVRLTCAPGRRRQEHIILCSLWNDNCVMKAPRKT